MRTPQETAYRCMFGTPCTLCWNALGFLDKTNVLSLNPIWSDGICSQIVQPLFYVAQQHTHSSSGLQIQACCKQCIEELPVYTRIKHDHDTPKTSISSGTDWAADKAACNVAEWFKDSGYEVVPDVFEVSSNFWGLVNKVHMETFFLHPWHHIDYCLAATSSHSHYVLTGQSEQDKIYCQAYLQGIRQAHHPQVHSVKTVSVSPHHLIHQSCYFNHERGSYYQICTQLPTNGSWMKTVPLVVSNLVGALSRGLHI